MFDKKIILAILFSTLSGIMRGQGGGAPLIKFDVDTADFGVVQEGDTVRYDFYFTNTGSADLIIRQAWPACGCTHPTFTKEPVKPGQRGVIHVEFHSEGFGGKEVLKEVIIISNAPENYARFKARITKRSAIKREETTIPKTPKKSAKPKGKPKRKK